MVVLKVDFIKTKILLKLKFSLLNFLYKKIPHVYIPFTRNVMEQYPVGFPNPIYFHVGPYTPYFGFSYEGIRSVPTMWPPRSNSLANPTTPLKPISRIA
jgi:hypothetical protein